MTIPNRPTRGLKITYALLAQHGRELESLSALQRELIRLVVQEHDAMFEDVKNRYERKLRDMLSSVDYGALTVGLKGMEQAMLQFGHQMEQLLCDKLRHVITAPHRTLVDEYLKLSFEAEPYPSAELRARISAATDLPLKQLNMWYANTRTRVKRKGGEVRASAPSSDTMYTNKGEFCKPHLIRF